MSGVQCAVQSRPAAECSARLRQGQRLATLTRKPTAFESPRRRHGLIVQALRRIDYTEPIAGDGFNKIAPAHVTDEMPNIHDLGVNYVWFDCKHAHCRRTPCALRNELWVIERTSLPQKIWHFGTSSKSHHQPTTLKTFAVTI